MRKLLYATVSFLVLLAACDRQQAAVPESSSSSEPGGAISVQVSGEPEETVVYETAVKAFQETSEDIDVELVTVPDKDDHLAKLTTAFAGGNAPDVFLINYREYSQFVTRGAVADGQSLASGRVDFPLQDPALAEPGWSAAKRDRSRVGSDAHRAVAWRS